MKHVVLPASKKNEVHVVLDDDRECYVITVSANRIPDVKVDLSDNAAITQYASALREGMRPIGLSHDGKELTATSMNQLVDVLQKLEKEGYRLQPAWEQSFLPHAPLEEPPARAKRKIKK